MATAKKAANSLLKSERALSTSKKTATKKVVNKRIVKTKTLKSSGSVSIKNNVGKVTATKKTTRRTKVAAPDASKTVKKTKTLVPAIPSQMGLALLSPYRFPVDIDKLAVGTARFGGIFFVLVGAIFTLLLSDNVFSTDTQVASTISSDTTLQSGTGDSSGLTTTVNTKPQAEFGVNNPSEVTGTAQVKVKVPMASRVTLMAFFKTQGRDVTFGSPAKVSEDTWEMNIDTRQYDDGEYKLKALIVNQYGTYESVDDSYIVFANSAEENTSETSTQTNTTQTTSASTTYEATTTEPTSQASGVLTVDKKESSTELRFELNASGAQKVKIHAKDRSGVTKLLGYAYESNSTTWKYRWNLSGVAAGTYEVYAEVDAATDFKSNAVTVKVLTTISTETQTTTTLTTTATHTVTTATDKPLAPEIKIGLDKSSPLSNIVNAKIEVEGAQSVEVFVLPKNSLVQKYLGVARKVDDKVWLYAWDTRTTPNAEYKLFVYVKNAFGTYTKESSSYIVQNVITQTYSEEQQVTIDKLTSVAKEEPVQTYVPQVVSEPIEIKSEDSTSTDAPSVSPVTSPVSEPEAEGTEAEELIAQYREILEKEMQRLASALRVKDENEVFEIKERLNSLKRDIVNAHIGTRAEAELVAVIDEYLTKTIKRVEEDVVRIEKVIVERTKLQAEADADKDGISDYDEVALYNTNPYSADTDGDSFPDGAEILKGYDPLDAVSEVLIAYESPKEAGIVREDILQVESVITATPNEEVVTSVPTAIISGKGLPNSFVTLYIFSTPVVITVKTDKDGNWNYRFDKELEDGEHQVYVGVTDNAGKIVAKSEPFTFIKEAQAFTGATNMVSEIPTDEPKSFASQYALYLVLSISVVAIGLVLILLGLHLDARSRKMPIVQNGAQEAV